MSGTVPRQLMARVPYGGGAGKPAGRASPSPRAASENDHHDIGCMLSYLGHIARLLSLALGVGQCHTVRYYSASGHAVKTRPVWARPGRVRAMYSDATTPFDKCQTSAIIVNDPNR